MKTPNHLTNQLCRIGFCAAMFLCVFSAQADPIELPEKPVTPEIAFLIVASILLEAVCILFLLRRFRRPRFFIAWIFGMHLLTYPGFLSLLWLLQDMRPAVAVAFGEGLVVVGEGILIYLICSFAPAKQSNPRPSLFRCWLVSLAGNACSLIAFPFLTKLYETTFGV
jgi:multisubunit Na+/H+ antiporter MnhB subunit